MKANDGQFLTLVSFGANNSAVVLTLLNGTLVHRRFPTMLELICS